MARRNAMSWSLEKYHGLDVRVDRNGVFFVPGEGFLSRLAEAPTRDELTEKVRRLLKKPNVHIEAMDLDDGDAKKVVVTGALPDGTLMVVDAKGARKHRESWSELYVANDELAAEYVALVHDLSRLAKKRGDLLDKWPKVDAAAVRFAECGQ